MAPIGSIYRHAQHARVVNVCAMASEAGEDTTVSLQLWLQRIKVVPLSAVHLHRSLVSVAFARRGRTKGHTWSNSLLLFLFKWFGYSHPCFSTHKAHFGWVTFKNKWAKFASLNFKWQLSMKCTLIGLMSWSTTDKLTPEHGIECGLGFNSKHLVNYPV